MGCRTWLGLPDGRQASAVRPRQQEEAARGDARDVLRSLSPREADVADLLMDGLRTAEIAERLGLSPRTVEMHRTRLLRRVGARTTAEAVRIIQRARELAGDG